MEENNKVTEVLGVANDIVESGACSVFTKIPAKCMMKAGLIAAIVGVGVVAVYKVIKVFKKNRNASKIADELGEDDPDNTPEKK